MNIKKEGLFFWRKFPYSHWNSALLLVALLSIIWMLIARYFGTSWVYQWVSSQQALSQEIYANSFENGLLPFQIKLPVYFFQYQYLAKDLQLPTWSAYLWLGAIVVGVSAFITAITYFKRLYFLIATAVVLIFIISLRIDVLGVLGTSKWIAQGIPTLVFLCLIYYFHTFGKLISFWKRFLIHLLAMLLLIGFVLYVSPSSTAVFYLSGYAMLLPALLSIMVIFLVSTEIPYTFLSIVSSQSATGKIQLRNFHIFMVFYIGNLVLLYLKNTKTLVLDIFYLDDVFILAVSMVLGIWSIRYNPVFKSIVPTSLRTWVYAGLLMVAGASIAYVHSVANEAATAVIEDLIVYSHLSFAIIYWVYAIFNLRKQDTSTKSTPFSTIFYENQDEKYIPLYLARGCGFLIMSLFIFKENTFVIKQSIAGYYMGLGDAYFLHYSPYNEILADDYYANALGRDPLNHRAWFARASLLSLKKTIKPEDQATRANYLVAALQRDPQPQDYVLIAQEFEKAGQAIVAQLELRKGFAVFPKSAEIASNIAIKYANNKVADSAAYYMETAKKYSSKSSKTEIDINFLSILAQNPILPADSVEAFLTKNQVAAYEVNRLAVLNIYGKRSKELFQLNLARKSLQDTSMLSIEQAAYLYNFVLTNDLDDTTALHLSKKLLRTKSNADYHDALRTTQEAHYLRTQNNQEGIETSRFLSYVSKARHELNLIKYLLYLEEFEQAGKLSENLASTPNYQSAWEILYHWAAATTHTGNTERAKVLWQSLIQDTLARSRYALSKKMLQILEANANQWADLDDSTRFGLVYYRPDVPFQLKKTLLNQLKNADLETKAFTHLIKICIENKDIALADSLMNALDKSKKVTLSTQSGLNLTYLAIAYHKNDKTILHKIIDEIPLVARHNHYRKFYKAWLSQDTKIAQQLYKEALAGNPFDLDLYPEIIKFYNEKLKNQDQAYNLALQAIRFAEENPKAWKLYILQSIRNGYIDFAEQGLEKLKSLAPKEYEPYKAIFEQAKALESK